MSERFDPHGYIQKAFDFEWEIASGVGVLLSTLDCDTIVTVANLTPAEWVYAAAELLAYVYFYDQRGGGIERMLKGDKQGLGLTKRNKKRVAAQEMVTLLGAVAHNLIVWSRGRLAAAAPKVPRYGVLRMVRDVFQVHGRLVLDPAGQIVAIILNHAIVLRECLTFTFAKL